MAEGKLKGVIQPESRMDKRFEAWLKAEGNFLKLPFMGDNGQVNLVHVSTTNGSRPKKSCSRPKNNQTGAKKIGTGAILHSCVSLQNTVMF